jgi:hypothetical protein
MNRLLTSRGAWVVVALLVALAVGGAFGRLADPPKPSAKVESTTRKPVVADRPTSQHPARVHAARTPKMLPSNLHELDGKDFIAALPDLQQRARAGDVEATKVLFERLQGCSAYMVRSDTDIRKAVDNQFQRQRDIQRRIRERKPDFPLDPAWDVGGVAYQQALQRDFDRRDRCTSLTRQQIESRLEVAKLAIQRGDRAMVIALGGIGQFSVEDAELVRHADALIELRAIEIAALDRLIDAGDIDALSRAAYGYSNDSSLLPNDLIQAYTHAYAWLQADSGGDPWGMQRFLDGLVKGGLSAQQIDEARARGEAIYRRCCTGAPRPAGH